MLDHSETMFLFITSSREVKLTILMYIWIKLSQFEYKLKTLTDSVAFFILEFLPNSHAVSLVKFILFSIKSCEQHHFYHDWTLTDWTDWIAWLTVTDTSRVDTVDNLDRLLRWLTDNSFCQHNGGTAGRRMQNVKQAYHIDCSKQTSLYNVVSILQALQAAFLLQKMEDKLSHSKSFVYCTMGYVY